VLQQQLQKSEPVHNRKKQNKNNNNKKRKNSKRWLNRWQLYKSLLAPFLSISIILIIIVIITTMLLRCSLHVCSRASSEVHGHPKIPTYSNNFSSLFLSPPSLPYLHSNHHPSPAAANCTRSIMNPNNSRAQYQQSSSPS
jgi:hypothetical protein